MKDLLRIYLFYVFALWLNTQIFQGSFNLGQNVVNLFLGAAILALLNLILKPILKLLFFPVNMMTLGLFSLIINAIIFYIFLRLIPGISISAWVFPGFSLANIHVSSVKLTYIETLFAASLATSLITSVLTFLVE
jgi:putative membrane protein